ncbi:MAG: hypothetical protein AAFO29_09070 [Actinomycetota bacterium]
MRPYRPVLFRTVGYLTLVGLLGLNGWLLLLNLAKHDRLPDALDRVPGVAAAGATDDVLAGADPDLGVGVGAGDGQAVAGSDDAESFNAGGATIVDGGESPGTIQVDQWPGGRGPVPDGPPIGRQVRVAADGQLRLTGMAPSWAVVTAVVDGVAGQLGIDPAMIVVDVSWHPEASSRPGDGEVVLEGSLVYRPGQIDLPDGGAASLTPIIQLLGQHPELYVVAVGLVDGEAADEQSAVALGRTSVVADAFVGAGIDADRVVTSVAASAPAVATEGGGDGAAGGGDRVVVRVENLLVFGATG